MLCAHACTNIATLLKQHEHDRALGIKSIPFYIERCDALLTPLVSHDADGVSNAIVAPTGAIEPLAKECYDRNRPHLSVVSSDGHPLNPYHSYRSKEWDAYKRHEWSRTEMFASRVIGECACVR